MNELKLTGSPESLADETQDTQKEQAPRQLSRRRRLRRLMPTLLVTLLYVVLVFLMFRLASQGALTPAVLSLRYHASLASQQVADAKHYWANPDLAPKFTASYWQEAPLETLSTSRGEVGTPVLYVDGDMAAVLPVEFLQGGYPSALESRGLAISEGLAWQLFGGTRVAGSTLNWKGRDFVVRGVFKGEELRLLAQIDAGDAIIEGFTGIELVGDPEDKPREAAKAYVQKAGLPEPDVLLGAQAQVNVLRVMAWLPAIVLVLWFAGHMALLLHRASFWTRQFTWLVVLLLLAFVIPWALALLPGWVIPTKWSDFNHWSEFFNQLRTHLTEWMSIKPSWLDVRQNQLLILQGVLLVPTLLTLFSTICQWELRLDTTAAARARTETEAQSC